MPPTILDCDQIHFIPSPRMFSAELDYLRRHSLRSLLSQALNILTVLSTSLALWKGLSILVDSESPVVVVLSGSMEPAFYRGDLLFLSMPKGPLNVGDIVVYNPIYGGTPIVHRILETHDEWVYESNADCSIQWDDMITETVSVSPYLLLQLRGSGSADSHKGGQ